MKMYGGGNTTIWGTEMNTNGFMGVVDKIWILLNRISIILAIVMLIGAIIAGIVAAMKGGQGMSGRLLRGGRLFR